jgi:hypothetical protein
MSADSFLYFAYGSNMPTARIRARCPSAKAVGIAELPGHELRWHKRSTDGSGKCDVITSDAVEARVFGVIYEIAQSERAKLDLAEGNDYEAVQTVVHSGAQLLTVTLYRAKAADPTLRPYSWYHALVVAGAKEHGLPAPYIAGLESVPADEDSDRARHDQYMALIEGVRA